MITTLTNEELRFSFTPEEKELCSSAARFLKEIISRMERIGSNTIFGNENGGDYDSFNQLQIGAEMFEEFSHGTATSYIPDEEP